MCQHQFTSADVASILAVVGEQRGRAGDFPTRVQGVLAGLCRLVRADAAIAWEVLRPPGQPQRVAVLAHVGHSVCHELTESALQDVLADVGRALACTGGRHGYAGTGGDSAGGAGSQRIYSFRTFTHPDRAVCIVLHRNRAPAFTPKEVATAALIHAHVDADRPGERFEPEHPAIALSLRQRQVLQFLLGGDTEKEVAARLGISIHTAHCHVKEVYRRLCVTSRPELLSLWLAGPASLYRPRVGGPGGERPAVRRAGRRVRSADRRGHTGRPARLDTAPKVPPPATRRSRSRPTPEPRYAPGVPPEQP